MKITFTLLFFFTFIMACEKISYHPDRFISYTGTLALAHRGGGNDTLKENSLAACKFALGITDGIEVDIQISKDKTIWLAHNPVVMNCNTEQKCFIETADIDIALIKECNGIDYSYTRLEDVMKYMDDNNIRKYISIDLKGWTPCHPTTLDIEGNMRFEAEEVIRLAEKYNLTSYLIFETQLMTVLTWIKEKNSKVAVYVTSFGDFERGMLLALKNGLDGISFKSHFKDSIDLEKMDLLHKKGLKLMAWNIPDSAHMNYLKSVNVDLIQIDL